MNNSELETFFEVGSVKPVEMIPKNKNAVYPIIDNGDDNENENADETYYAEEVEITIQTLAKVVEKNNGNEEIHQKHEDDNNKKLKRSNKKKEKDLPKKENKNKAAEVLSAIKKRKAIRITFLCLFLAILILSLIFGVYYMYARGNYYISSGTDLNLVITNCTMNIKDMPSNQNNQQIQFSYRIKNLIIDNNPYPVQYTSQNSQSNIVITSYYGIDSCSSTLYIDPTAIFNSITINCPLSCQITQDSQKINVLGALKISGSIIYSNFRSVSSNSVNYTSDQGYVAFNYLEVSSGSQNSFTINTDGDIFVQTNQGFLVNFQSGSNTFCFSGIGSLNTTNPSSASSLSTTISGSALICINADCSDNPSTIFNLVSTNGNLYANYIPGYAQPIPSNPSIFQSNKSSLGLKLDQDLQPTISNFSTQVTNEVYVNPILLINLGYSNVKSSTYTKYIVSSNPAFAFAKPWWLGTFSAALLYPDVLTLNGRLLPGFCPQPTIYSLKNYNQIQTLIEGTVNETSYVYAFIWDSSFPSINTLPSSSNGIFNYSQNRRNINDYWYSITSYQGNLMVSNNDINKSTPIIISYIISLIFAGFMSAFLLQIFLIALKVLFNKAVDSSDHLDNYSKIEKPHSSDGISQTKPKKKSNTSQKNASTKDLGQSIPEGSILQFLKNAPSVAALTDYVISLIYAQTANSAKEFFNYLFAKANEDEGDPVKNPEQVSMKLTEAKTYFEKFCFLNRFNETDLQDPKNNQLLEKYGFSIITSKKTMSEVYIKLLIKAGKKLKCNNLSSKNDDPINTQDSLDLFMSNFVQVTQFETDQTDIIYFEHLYNEFCELNALNKVILSTSLMNNKYQIQTRTVPAILISRIDTESNYRIMSFKTKILSCLKRTKGGNYAMLNSKQLYKIDRNNIENHFKMLTNNYEKMTATELERSTVKMIIFPGWYIWDAATVIFHLIALGILTIPLILLCYLMEFQYSLWSLKNPQDIIFKSDLANDPETFLYKLFNGFSWNLAILIIVCIIWIVSLFDIFLSYVLMDFPQRKLFTKTQQMDGIFIKILRYLHWGAIFLAVGFYFGYIGLVLIWAVLAAIITPNAFLPYASGAGTFVTFCMAKYNQFKKMFKDGKDALSKFIIKIFSGVFADIGKKLLIDINKATESIADKSKEILNSKAFDDVTSNLASAGLIDKDTILDIQTKVNMLDPAKLAASGMQSDILKDPMTIAKEADKLVEKLKEACINKIKDEAQKRDIPVEIIDAGIAEALGNKEQVKKAICDLLKKNKFLSEQMTEMLGDIAFPKALNKEEFTFYLNEKLSKIIVEEFKLEKIPSLNTVFLNKIIVSFDHITNNNRVALNDIITSLVQNIPTLKKYEYLQNLLPLFDITAKLSGQTTQAWIIKEPIFKFIEEFSKYIINKTILDKKDATKVLEKIASIIAFLGLFICKHENISSVKDNTQIFDSKQKRLIINKFIENIVPNIFPKSSNVDITFYMIHNLMIQPESELSQDVIKGLENAFGINLGPKNNFISFCYNLSLITRHNPFNIYQTIQKNQRKFSILDESLCEFIRMICYYDISDLMKFENNPENSTFLQKLALEKIKLNVNDLVGFLDLMYNKNHKISTIDSFIKTMCQKSNLPEETAVLIKALFYLVISHDEHLLVSSCYSLKLTNIPFLLAGKGLLNFEWIENKEFDELGLSKGTLDSLSEVQEILEKSIKNIEDDNNGGITSPHEDNKIDQNALLLKKKNQESIQNNLKLIKVYNRNWNILQSQDFTSDELLSIIDGLDNSNNKLNDKLQLRGNGSSVCAADIILTLINCYNFNFKVRKLRMVKEHENIITEISTYLKINESMLIQFIQLFILQEPNDIVNTLANLLPEINTEKNKYIQVFEYCLFQVNIYRKQHEFVSNLIKSSPYGSLFILKLMFDQNHSKLNSKELLSIISNCLNSYKLINSNQVISKLVKFILAANGNWGKSNTTKKNDKSHLSFSSEMGFTDKRLAKLAQISTTRDRSDRLIEIANMFPYDHPFKVMLAWYGILTNSTNFKIQNEKTKNENLKYETPKAYLSKFYNIYEEFFEIFDHLTAQTISEFADGITMTIKRLSSTTEIDNNLIKSILRFINCEKFDPASLAKKLSVSSDIIDFLISMVRLRNLQVEGKQSEFPDEINSFKNTPATEVILALIKVNQTELLSLLSLVTNSIKGDIGISQMLSNLKLNQKLSATNTKLILTLNQPVNPRINLSNLSPILGNIEKEIRSILEDLKLDPHITLFISRLVSGDFLAFQYYRSILNWLIPNDTKQAESIIKLYMGLCGVCNNLVQVESKSNLYQGMSNEIQEFSTMNEKLNKNQKTSNNNNKIIMPNNSLAYAIYCLNQVTSIPPCWIQAFTFDENFYLNDIEYNSKNLKKEFIYFLVLNFLQMSDYDRQCLSCQNFIEVSIEKMKEALDQNLEVKYTLEEVEKLKENFTNKGTSLYEKLYLNFKWDDILQLSENTSIKMHKILFTSGLNHIINKNKVQEFYESINQNIIYLVMKLKLAESSNEQKKSFIEYCIKMSPNSKIIPLHIPLKLVQCFKKNTIINETVKEDLQNDDVELFDKIMLWWKIVVYTYNTLASELNQPDNHEGFEMTSLSTLASIATLRKKKEFNIDYVKALFNLNAIILNIQRKLFYSDISLHIDKFRLIKLLGLSSGFRISNVVQFCLPKSLVDETILSDIKKAKNDRQELTIKVNYAARCLFEQNYVDDEDNVDFWAGPLIFEIIKSKGILQRFYTEWHDAGNWDRVVMACNLKDKYLGNPELMNFNFEKETYFIDADLLDDYRIKENEVKSKYRGNVDVTYLLESRSIVEAGLTGSTQDIITGNNLKEVKEQAIDFEVNLFNENMNTIINLINGELDKIGDPKSFIGGKGPEVVEYYKALIGLHSFSKIAIPQNLNIYLGILSNILASDLRKLTEIIGYIFDDSSLLNDTLLFIDSQDLTQLLQIWKMFQMQKEILRYGLEASNEQIPWAILGLSGTEQKLLEVIVDCYNLVPRGWINLTELLEKKSSNKSKDNTAQISPASISKLFNFDEILLKRALSDNPNIKAESNRLFDYVYVPQDEKPDHTIDMGDLRLIYILKNLSTIPKQKKEKGKSDDSSYDKIRVSFMRGLIEDDSIKLTKILFPTKNPQTSKKKPDNNKVPVTSSLKSKVLVVEEMNNDSDDDIDPEKKEQPHLIIEEGETTLKKIIEIFKNKEKNKDKSKKENLSKNLKLFKLVYALSKEKFALKLPSSIKSAIIAQIIFDLKTLYIKNIEELAKLEEEHLNRLVNIIYGLLGWDMQILCEGLFDKSTAHEFTLLYSLIVIKHLNKFYPLVEENQKLINVAIRNFIFYAFESNNFGEKKIFFGRELRWNPRKHIETKFTKKKDYLEKSISNLFTRINDPIDAEFNWIDAILSTFNKSIMQYKYNKPLEIKSDKKKFYYIAKAILTGEFLYLLANNACTKAKNEIAKQRQNINDLLNKNKDKNLKARKEQLRTLNNLNENLGSEFIQSFIQIISKITKGIHDHDLVNLPNFKIPKKKIQTSLANSSFLSNNLVKKNQLLPLERKATKMKDLGMNAKSPTKNFIKLQKIQEIQDTQNSQKERKEIMERFDEFWKFEDLDKFFSLFESDQKNLDLVLLVCRLLFKFYLIASDDGFKAANLIKDTLVNLANSFLIEFATIAGLSQDEITLLKSVGSILLGLTVTEGGFDQDKIPDKAELVIKFFNDIVLKAFPKLKETPFNPGTINNVLQLITMIKRDYVSNLKNIDRLLEIAINLFNVMGSIFPSLNKDLAIAVLGLAQGKFENLVKILTTYFAGKVIAEREAARLEAKKLEDEAKLEAEKKLAEEEKKAEANRLADFLKLAGTQMMNQVKKIGKKDNKKTGKGKEDKNKKIDNQEAPKNDKDKNKNKNKDENENDDGNEDENEDPEASSDQSALKGEKPAAENQNNDNGNEAKFGQNMNQIAETDTQVQDIIGEEKPKTNEEIKEKSEEEAKAKAQEEEATLRDLEKQFSEKASQIYSYIINIKSMLDFRSLKARLPSLGNDGIATVQMDPQQWTNILRRIQEGEASPMDVFHILNKSGGGIGKINPNQFKILAARLGFQLSDHRVNEIFSKIKGTNAAKSSLTLNIKDFNKAMLYLMEKSLQTALQMLGISMEQLAILLIQLIFLLILILAFIFVGIQAFAIGGTFGSIINSLFPIIGGGSLGKKSDSDQEKLNEENIASACAKSVAIIKSPTDQ